MDFAWASDHVLNTSMKRLWRRVMDKRQKTKARQCAIVAEDDAGHWVARGPSGGASRPADSAQAAILRALYGRRPVGAVLLVPPKGRLS
jgi:hypothetical protein